MHHFDLTETDDRVVSFGMPFHGKVRNGTLTLPNGSTMPHPQPETGSVMYVKPAYSEDQNDVKHHNIVSDTSETNGECYQQYATMTGDPGYGVYIYHTTLAPMQFVLHTISGPFLYELVGVELVNGAYWEISYKRRVFGIIGAEESPWEYGEFTSPGLVVPDGFGGDPVIAGFHQSPGGDNIVMEVAMLSNKGKRGVYLYAKYLPFASEVLWLATAACTAADILDYETGGQSATSLIGSSRWYFPSVGDGNGLPDYFYLANGDLEACPKTYVQEYGAYYTSYRHHIKMNGDVKPSVQTCSSLAHTTEVVGCADPVAYVNATLSCSDVVSWLSCPGSLSMEKYMS